MVKYFRPVRESGGEDRGKDFFRCVGEKLQPEGFRHVQVKIPENTFSQAFRTVGFENSVAFRACKNDKGSEVPDAGLSERQIDDADAPGIGRFLSGLDRAVGSGRQAIGTVKENQGSP